MAKKSKELSEEDKVTETPKKGTKGKKIVAEQTQVEDASEGTTPQEVATAPVEVTVQDESEVAQAEIVQVDSDSVLLEVNPESEESIAEEDQAPIDLSGLSKVELLDLLKEKLAHGVSAKLDKVVHELKSAFEELSTKDREEALQQFLGDGGVADDFSFRGTEVDKEFNSLFNDFRQQLGFLRKEAERQKEKNLQTKTELLNKLRDLVDGEETTLSMAAVKSIQETWKTIGPVPLAQSKNLWASFNALMDRFYDNRSIYFELKELDRKKNLESKLELCEKAEALKSVEDLKDAIRMLNELHEEFKHLGPVPREEQEQVWVRFKAASDVIYDRRKEFFDGQKDVIKKNLVEKEALIVILAPFGEYKADRIKDWNTKTKEILEIVGGAEALSA